MGKTQTLNGLLWVAVVSNGPSILKLDLIHYILIHRLVLMVVIQRIGRSLRFLGFMTMMMVVTMMMIILAAMVQSVIMMKRKRKVVNETFVLKDVKFYSALFVEKSIHLKSMLSRSIFECI